MALYDLISRKYINAEIQAGRFKNEHEAICNLTDRQKSTNTKKILVADWGLGSYNFYLHAEGVGAFYLVRITESRARSLLGKERFPGLGKSFDVTVTRHLVRHHRKSEYLHQDCLDDYLVIPFSTTSAPRLGTDCLLGFIRSGLSPDYTTCTELAHLNNYKRPTDTPRIQV